LRKQGSPQLSRAGTKIRHVVKPTSPVVERVALALRQEPQFVNDLLNGVTRNWLSPLSSPAGKIYDLRCHDLSEETVQEFTKRKIHQVRFRPFNVLSNRDSVRDLNPIRR